MGVLELIAAFGFGAVATKVIDAAWIQPFLEKKEHRSWSRDRRLEAYTDLSKNLLAFSLEHKDTGKSPFENFAIAARAILLIRDRDLAKAIDIHIAKRDRFFRISDGQEKLEKGEDKDTLYYELYREARELVERLTTEIHDG